MIKIIPYVERKVKRKYIAAPWCDECDIALVEGGDVLCSLPERYVYYCPKCNKKYSFYSTEIGLRYEYEEV